MEQSMWYYIQDGQQVGPVAKDQLLSLFSQQILTVDTSIWATGMDQWQPANTVPGFFPETMSAAMPGAPVGYQPVRPTSVTVLGILCIVFGGLGLLCTPLSLFGIFMPQPDMGVVNPYDSAPMKIYLLFSIVLGFFFAIVELAAGIGLLNLKNWARVAALIYGWVAIASGIIGTIINMVIVIPAIQQMGSDGGPEAIGGMIGSSVGGICGGIFGLIFPIFLVIYMRKPHVVAACCK